MILISFKHIAHVYIFRTSFFNFVFFSFFFLIAEYHFVRVYSYTFERGSATLYRIQVGPSSWHQPHISERSFPVWAHFDTAWIVPSR